MQEPVLIAGLAAVFIFGFFVMRKLDRFLERERAALTGERLDGKRAGRMAAAACALLAALAAWTLVEQGFDGARMALPLLALPALVLALCAGRL